MSALNWFYQFIDPEYTLLILSVALLVGSLLIFRRFKRWSTVVQLIGSSAYFLKHLAWSLVIATAVYTDTHNEPMFPFLVHRQGNSYSQADWLYVLDPLSACFLVGFVWFSISFSKADLTKRSSQPPTVEKISA